MPTRCQLRGWWIVALLFGLAASVILPWQYLPGTPFTLQRIAQWLITGATLLVAGLALRRELYAKLSLAWQGPRKLVALPTLALIVAAVLLAPLPRVALLELSYLALLAALILLVAVATPCLSTWGWRLLGAGAALFCLVYAVLALDHISLVWDFGNRHDFGPGFDNVRFFADVAAGVMPLALLYVVVRPRPSWLAAALVSVPLGVWWWMLWVSESRAALLGLITGSLLVLWLFGRAARWPLATLAVSALLGLLGWWLLNPLVQETAASPFLRDITSSSGRLALWSDSLRYAWQHFPLGLGPMGFADDGQLRSAHAHNLFLNIAAEWGLPLALLLLAVTLKACLDIRRRVMSLDAAHQPLYACVVLGFVSVLVNVQFAGAQVMPVSALTLALVVGLALGFRPRQAPHEQHDTVSQAGLKGTLLWSLMMLMLGYQAVAGVSLHALSRDSSATCFEAMGRSSYYPRFWPQGRLECMRLEAPAHWLLQ
ncbi:O-antigen ligase family protein [Halomonas sp. PBN3]|uniref:O-antigen ligase family protein n=1 Tax=Halomonas sp. PBN3 TaxID=1397528 RepID=UPI0012689FF4|nr:O-antigen ligase family protein [Halomonas sp. PBN3]